MDDIYIDGILNRRDLSVIIAGLGVSPTATDSLTELVMAVYERGKRDALAQDREGGMTLYTDEERKLAAWVLYVHGPDSPNTLAEAVLDAVLPVYLHRLADEYEMTPRVLGLKPEPSGWLRNKAKVES